MPTPVLAAAVSRVGDRAVITGGINQVGVANDAVQVFNLRTMQWEQPLKLALGRAMHDQVTLDDHRVLVVAGQTGTVQPLGTGLRETDHCEILDLDTGKSTPIKPLGRAIAEPTAHELSDGRAIVIGGGTASIFNPKSNEWERGVALRSDRRAHASAVLEGDRVIVVGGVRNNTIELIDVKGRFSRMLAAQLPIKLGVDDSAVVALPGNRAWVLGGQNSKTGETTDETWIIDVSNEQKATTTDGPRLRLAHGIADACLARVGRWVIVAGGESQQRGGDVELQVARLLDLVTLKVHDLPMMKAGHDDAVALALDDGMIVFGGFVATKIEMQLPGAEVTRTFTVPTAVPAVERLILPADPLK